MHRQPGHPFPTAFIHSPERGGSPGHRPPCRGSSPSRGARPGHVQQTEQLPEVQRPARARERARRQCPRSKAVTAAGDTHAAPGGAAATRTGSRGGKWMAKYATQPSALKPKQTLLPIPGHRFPTTPASASHLKGLSLPGRHLRSSQLSQKGLNFPLTFKKTKVSSENDNKNTCVGAKGREG